jgi:uncharacterized protein (DUF2267 family)
MTNFGGRDDGVARTHAPIEIHSERGLEGAFLMTRYDMDEGRRPPLRRRGRYIDEGRYGGPRGVRNEFPDQFDDDFAGEARRPMRGDHERGSRRPYSDQRGRSGLRVFDKTLQTTHIWLNDIVDAIGPDKQHAWKVLSVVLHALRDRLPVDDAAHLGAQLPLLIRGLYYDQFKPARQPTDCDLEDFIGEVGEWLADARPTDPHDATAAVFQVLSRHIPVGEIDQVQQSLPRDLRRFWRQAEEMIVPPPEPRRGRRAYS